MTRAEALRTCPVCKTVVRPYQVRVRRHHLAIVCYALTIPAGVLGYWIMWKLGLFDGVAHRGKMWPVGLTMLPLFLVAWTLPKVRVVRCPTCQCERRQVLRRRP